MSAPTKADLAAEIEALKAERRETPEEELVRALARVVAGPDATKIKHLFYRNDTGPGGMLNLSLDMHE